MPSDAVNELEAIDLWHSQIGDQDIGHVGIKTVQCVSSRPRRAHAGAGRLQHLGNEAERIRLVVDRQHVYAVQIWRQRSVVRSRPIVDARGERGRAAG